jgi:hypothetical protein
MGLGRISADALAFCDKWMEQIDRLNTDMKSIRKLQTDYELVYMCNTDQSLLETFHPGIIFEKQCSRDNTFLYTVYLTSLRKFARVKTMSEYDEYSEHSFRLYFFAEEDNIRNKVKLQVVTV